LTAQARQRTTPAPPAAEQPIATAYNQAGDDYLHYADGDTSRLFSFDSRYAYGDRRIWETLEIKLRALHISGAETVRILDMGCGPGTWLRRVVTRARELGFRHIIARGFDIAEDQVIRARELSQPLCSRRGVELTFEVADICERYPESDRSVDLCLCLYGVLNHLPAHDLSPILREVARVTQGDFITTVRAVGSIPTVYVGAVEDARTFLQDNRNNTLDVEFRNGRRVRVSSHLFKAAEIKAIIIPHLAIKDLLGLDLFHSRFADDPRWNVGICQHSVQFGGELERLERRYCHDAGFIDHATHLLLVGTTKELKVKPALAMPKVVAAKRNTT
jgi:SAM-dependent methyltransferase